MTSVLEEADLKMGTDPVPEAYYFNTYDGKSPKRLGVQ
jgi:hypothetical protein